MAFKFKKLHTFTLLGIIFALITVNCSHLNKNTYPNKQPLLMPFAKYKLNNGLEVILHQDKRTPFVSVNVWYHVGAVNEEINKTGFAHLFEHLMFQGTPHVGDDKHFAYLQSAGAYGVNGTTSFDRTNYFQTVPKEELSLALWLESDRMGWLMAGMTQAKLDEQRNVVKNERRQNYDNRPYGLAKEMLWKKIFPKNHPFYGLVIGSMDDLDAATMKDVKDFYKAYYTPANATLVIAGDFAINQAKNLVDKYFSSLPSSEKPKKIKIKPPKLNKQILVKYKEVLGKTDKLLIQYITPKLFAKGDAELDILSFILTGSQSSIFNDLLVRQKQMVRSISCNQSSYGDLSIFTIEANLKANISYEKVLQQIDSTLTNLQKNPPTQQKINQAVNTLETTTYLQLESISKKADLLQSYNHFANNPGWLNEDLARYKNIAPKNIAKVIKKYLSPSKRAILIAKVDHSNNKGKK